MTEKNYNAWEVMLLTDEEKDEWMKKIEEKHGFDILIHHYHEGWSIEWYEPIEA